MTPLEHNGPGFHYVIQWSKMDSYLDHLPSSSHHDVTKSRIHTAIVDDAYASVYVVEGVGVYTAYNISVQAANKEGFAMGAYTKVVGYSAEDGKKKHHFFTFQHPSTLPSYVFPGTYVRYMPVKLVVPLIITELSKEN